MPDLQRTIDIIFNGIDRTGQASAAAIKNIDAVGDAVVDIAQPAADATKLLLGLEAAALGLAVALGKSAYDASVKFESAQIDLAKVLDESEGSVDQFTDNIIKLSNETGIAATELLEGLTVFKTAGFDIEESASLLADSLVLIVSSGLDASTSADILKKTLIGLELEVDQAARVIENLNKVSDNYALTSDELAKGLSDLAPAAAAAGLSLEDTIAVLTPVIELFGSGSEASRALVTSLARLTGELPKVQDTLAKLGVAQKDANGELRFAKDILFDVGVAFQDLSENQKLQTAALLAGQDQAVKFLAVVRDIGKVQDLVAFQLQESSTALTEYELRLKSAETAGNRFDATFQNVLATIGTGFRSEVTGVTNAFADLFAAVEDAIRNEGALDELFAGLAPLIADVEQAVRDFTAVLPTALDQADLGAFVEAFEQIFGVFSGGNLSTVEGVKNAIEGLGQTFLSLTNFSAGVIDFFQGLFSALAPIAKLFSELDSETIKWLGTLGGAALVVGPITGIITSLTGALSGIAKLGGIAGALGDAAGISAIGSAIGRLAGVAGVGLLTFELAKLAGTYEALNDVLFEGDQTLGTWLFDVTQGSEEAAQATADLVPELDKEAAALANLNTQLQATLKERSGSLQTESDLLALQKTAADILENQAAAARNAADAAAVLSGEQANAEEVAKGWRIETVEGIKTYTQIGETGATALAKVEEATRKAAAETAEAEKKANSFQIKMEEIASNERIQLIKSKVELDIAEVQANADIMESILENLAGTISSTGDLLGTLFSIDENPEFDRFGFDIKRQIDLENKLRQDAADKALELTDAQIKLIKERAAAINRGDPLITVNADGLEPEIEAFMWQILKRIQVRANADAAEFLLGIPAA